MRLSDDGKTWLKSLEGLSLKAYRDADGYSIGYGHFLGKDPALASRTITRPEAEQLFLQDIAKYEIAVSTTTPKAEPHQFDAMVVLTYNIGTAGFAGSTVARLHNLGDTQGAADAFRLWNKSTKNGVRAVDPVLVARREKEREIYLHGYRPPGSFPTPLPPVSSPSWPSGGLAVAPAAAPSPVRTASILSLAALALGWLLHRLAH